MYALANFQIYTSQTEKCKKRPVKGGRSNNLFPGFPLEREKTITSAPSLMVLVLNPFPSIQKLKYNLYGEVNITGNLNN